jgi:hypothetical protein
LDPLDPPLDISTAEILVKTLLPYWQHYRQETPTTLWLTPPLSDLNWSEVWQNYVQKGDNQTVWLIYPGSFADPMGYDLILADLSKDWRIPVILTLVHRGSLEHTLRQAIAFAGLARSLSVSQGGWILFNTHSEKILSTLVAQIEPITHWPCLGSLPLDVLQRQPQDILRELDPNIDLINLTDQDVLSRSPEEILPFACHLDWERLYTFLTKPTSHPSYD